MIIVDFHPGALHRITGIPFSEFINKDVDAEAIFSTRITRVSEQLRAAASYQQMVKIIEIFLNSLVPQKNYLAVDHLLTMAAVHPDQSVESLAKAAFLSPRQLERKLNERFGIGPKTFLRISRFNKSYRLHLKHPALSWFQIAMSCGYSDYQHMAKEYFQFACNTPAEFSENKAVRLPFCSNCQLFTCKKCSFYTTVKQSL